MTETEHQHDLRVWAAYLSGHALTSLHLWQSSIWNCRQLIREGRLTIKGDLPIEASELPEAIEVLANSMSIQRKQAVWLGRWTAQWIHQAELMLRELSCGDPLSEMDWAPRYPPGFKESTAIYRTVSTGLDRHPHLKQWFRFGQGLAEEGHCPWALADDIRRKLCTQLTSLHTIGRYPFLPPLIAMLRLRRPEKTLPDALIHLVDPVLKVVQLPLIEKHLRTCLRNGARPAPWIVLGRDGGRFFGRQFGSVEFRPGEWEALRTLCRKPSKQLERAEIIHSAGLKCSPRNLAVHITRLRGKLRPAIDAFFAGSEPPEYAADCFIVNLKTEPDGPYQLDVDPALVKIESAQPGREAANNLT